MRRILNQAANAAVKHKGSIFEIVYRRRVPRLGHNQTIGAIAHRLCRLIWLILHQGAIRPTTGNWRSKDFHLARFTALSTAPLKIGVQSNGVDSQCSVRRCLTGLLLQFR
jgi:hypothetical protein